MTSLTHVRLRTLGWLILPVTVVVVIPCWLVRLTHHPVAWQGSLGPWPHHLAGSAEGRPAHPPDVSERSSRVSQPSASRQVVGWLGAWCILNGLGLAAWCVNLFNVQGRGTPWPFDPPKQFVVSGPYRYVRNPMMLGISLILGGEALLAHSRTLFLYVLGLMVLAHLVVRYWEEPELTRRFGHAYRTYQRQVPRWIPRLPQRTRA